MGIKGNLPRKGLKKKNGLIKRLVHDERYNKVEGFFPSIDVH